MFGNIVLFFKCINTFVGGGNIPKDPIELSFWVAQNVLVDDDERIDLLNYDCAIARLQREIKLLIEVT